MPEERIDELEPEEDHEQRTSAEELAVEDVVEETMSESPDDASTVDDPSDARPEGSRDLGAGAGATTSDPGRQNPIIPGEGKIEEPT